MNKLRATILAVACLGLAGCDGGPTGTGDGAGISIQFRTAPSAQGRLGASTDLVADAFATLMISGTNGTLVIEDVRLILAEFELERADGECAGSVDDDDCEELELAPQFLQLPLQEGVVTAVRQEVPPGVYEEFEFEVENLEIDDDEDDEKAQLTAQLFETIRASFPDWPEEASLLVVGSFTPNDGTPTEFRVFFDAEIEVEMEFEPPLTISEADPDKIITVTVDPSVWFRRPDGTVVDLSQFDGRLAELEIEIEDGFTEIEVGD